MASTMRRPFGNEQPDQPAPQGQPEGESKDKKEQPTPSYVTDNPSVYGEPPKPEED